MQWEVLGMAFWLSWLEMEAGKSKERLPRGERQLNMYLKFLVKSRLRHIHKICELTRKVGKKLSIEETTET